MNDNSIFSNLNEENIHDIIQNETNKTMDNILNFYGNSLVTCRIMDGIALSILANIIDSFENDQEKEDYVNNQVQILKEYKNGEKSNRFVVRKTQTDALK